MMFFLHMHAAEFVNSMAKQQSQPRNMPIMTEGIYLYTCSRTVCDGSFTINFMS